MWSAIPVALLCMIVNLSKGKQGSGPEGDEVLLNTGGISFVLLERPQRTDLKPQRADLRLKWLIQGLRESSKG